MLVEHILTVRTVLSKFERDKNVDCKKQITTVYTELVHGENQMYMLVPRNLFFKFE